MSFQIARWIVDLEGSKWTLKVTCDVHNHPPAKYLEDHSDTERLSEGETSVLIAMAICHVRPGDILTLLKQKNLKNISTIKTICIARHKHRLIEQWEISDAAFIIKSIRIKLYWATSQKWRKRFCDWSLLGSSY